MRQLVVVAGALVAAGMIAFAPAAALAADSTTTLVVSSANPSVFGQSVTFTATVPDTTNGAAFPTGSVDFSIDGGAPTTVPLQNNGGPVLTAKLTISLLSVGSHTVLAVYNSNDPAFLTSSGSLSGGQVVNVGPPAVTSISPNSGPTTGGTAVTISGISFTGATSVAFGSINATSFTVISATQIGAIAPPGSLGAVDVTVRTPVGASAINSADQFSYTVPADSANLRKLQATVTPMAAQVWGQSTGGAMQSAVSEGFAGGGMLVSPSGSGMRFNFSADPDDQQRQVNADPFGGAYNTRDRAGPRTPRADDTAASRSDDAFAALGYADPVKARPLRVTEPREWLG